MAFNQSYPRLGSINSIRLPWLAELPVVGKALFVQPLVVYLAVACVPLLARLLSRQQCGSGAAGGRRSTRRTGEAAAV
ncbi:MAG: hypothetical protein ACR5LG_13890 [Sodalis sp. (in: enterobacteria)]|uniref:hypothetical protein n=1 Tax=Sodalis sp. (in: enterobacteria) TaxID=1898979 RepID=UPI003F3023B5